MSATIQCDIVSAEHEIFSGPVEFLSVTGALGDLGITPGHAPLLTTIQPGPLELRLAGGEERVYYVSGGYLEVQTHQMIILADTAQRAGDLDQAAADQARKMAEQDLAKRKGDLDYSKAAAQLADAVAQLRTLRRLREKR